MKQPTIIRINRPMSIDDVSLFKRAWAALRQMPMLREGSTVITIEHPASRGTALMGNIELSVLTGEGEGGGGSKSSEGAVVEPNIP